MNASKTLPNPAEVGQHLSRVRELAQLTQSDLSKKVSFSAAVLSRIENGERDFDLQEIDGILAQIGTEEARQFSESLKREWLVLPRPPLNHQNQEALWEAENACRNLISLKDEPNTPVAFERRLSEYVDECRKCASMILKREHQVAFIGSIGVGKSLAICKMLGLTIKKDDGADAPVLEVGGGGITVCEVHIRTGAEWGISIDPCSAEEIRQSVLDLTDHIRKSAGNQEDDLAAGDSQGISKEVARALRNMSGLTVTSKKGVDGKKIVTDPAKELAEMFPNQREVMVEILGRINLPRRDRRDIWYDPSLGKSPQEWLKETFSLINNGRHADFCLPKRIEVVVKESKFSVDGLSVRFIDTKGIDRNAAREDLEKHFDDPHTTIILCSTFNNAPSSEARLLLERAKEAGNRNLRTNAALLVLPRPNEALAMRDDAGTQVETSLDGYDLKGDQAAMALEPLGLHNLSIGFYNAMEDDADAARVYLSNWVQMARQSFLDRLASATEGAISVHRNFGEERIRAVIAQACQFIQKWLSQNTEVPQVQAHVQDSLMRQMTNVYASTVRATVRRDGEWDQLNYVHHIGHGSRRLAVLALEKKVELFSEICKTMSSNDEYPEAADLIGQAERVLRQGFDELLRKTQSAGQALFKEALKDPVLWQKCVDEWGKGAGFRDRVAKHNEAWFGDSARQSLEDQVKSIIGRNWSETIESVKALLDPVS